MNILKKIGKYSILLSIKESYLFSRNLLGLISHPFKTLRAIIREKDYSQALLVFGLPFYTLLAGLVFILSGRALIKAPKQWGGLAKASLFLVFSLSFVIFLYLVYWLVKILSLKRKQK